MSDQSPGGAILMGPMGPARAHKSQIAVEDGGLQAG